MDEQVIEYFNRPYHYKLSANTFVATPSPSDREVLKTWCLLPIVDKRMTGRALDRAKLWVEGRSSRRHGPIWVKF